jgi:hypothetical protein
MLNQDESKTVHMRGCAGRPGTSKVFMDAIMKAVRRGLTQEQTAVLKRSDKNAFKNVDQKGRTRG